MMGRRQRGGREGEGEWSPGAQRSYGARKIAEGTNAADMAIAGINSSGAIVREFVSLAKSNPIVGVVIAGIAIDVAFQAKLIDAGMKATLVTCLVTAFGVGVVVDAAEGLISAVTGGANSTADLIRPSATTIVENPPAAANASTPNRGGAGGLLGLARTAETVVPAGAMM